MKRILLILLLVALGVSFVGTLVFLYKRSTVAETVYETESPFVADIVKKTVATGSIVPREEVALKPRISGVIDAIYVEPGDRVARGDLIARIAVVPNMQALAAAEARVAEAKIRFEQAERDFDRNRNLHQQDLIPLAEFQEHETELAGAREELEAAEDNLAVIRRGTRRQQGASTNTEVRSTINGMALDVPVEVGNSVIEVNNFNEGTTIATVANMERMVFEGKVDESEVGKLRVGMELLLTVGAVQDETYHATLEYIAPKGVEEGGAIQFQIRAALELDPETFLRANYSANADIVLDRADHVLAIKESWLQFDGEQPYVEVRTGEQEFARREVELGLSDGLNIQVVSGVQKDALIKDPTSGHAPGAEPEAEQRQAA